MEKTQDGMSSGPAGAVAGGPSPATEVPASAPGPVATAAPAAPGSPSPAVAPTPAAASPSSPPGGPAGGRPPPDKVRTNVKLAGGMMVLLAVLLAMPALPRLADPSFTEEQVQTFADERGGNITVLLAGATPDEPARIELYNYNRTASTNATMAAPSMTIPAGTIAGRLEITWRGTTWRRNVLAFPAFATPVEIEPGTSPEAAGAWVLPDLTLPRAMAWVSLGVAAFLIVSGVLAFRLRARRVALAGAVTLAALGVGLFLLAVSVAGGNLALLLQPLLLALMGVFSVWAIRKGRDRFAPARPAAPA